MTRRTKSVVAHLDHPHLWTEHHNIEGFQNNSLRARTQSTAQGTRDRWYSRSNLYTVWTRNKLSGKKECVTVNYIDQWLWVDITPFRLNSGYDWIPFHSWGSHNVLGLPMSHRMEESNAVCAWGIWTWPAITFQLQSWLINKWGLLFPVTIQLSIVSGAWQFVGSAVGQSEVKWFPEVHAVLLNKILKILFLHAAGKLSELAEARSTFG